MVIEGHNQIWLKMSFYEKVLMIINYFVGGNILRNSEIQLYFYDNEIFIWIVSSKGLLLAYYISQEMNFIVHCICKRFWRVIRIYTYKIGRVNAMNKSRIDMYEKRLVISYRLKFIHRICRDTLLFEISKYITIPDMCRNDFILKSLVDDEVGTGN